MCSIVAPFVDALRSLLANLCAGQRDCGRAVAGFGGDRRLFRYDALARATRNFSPENKLGEGGFGPVYKGRLGDGREVAVKRLAEGSRQGEKEFSTEARLLSNVQHRNVVNLYGYCEHGADKLLVYEYVRNESLDKLLFADPEEESDPRRAELDWPRRYEVMLGMARGILYLHEDAPVRILHRDIKASNILLDDDFCPKIADFGMAHLFPEDKTHITTKAAGTNGYMAPEYLLRGSLSDKVDVYSFGVVVIELISGRKNTSFIIPDPECTSLVEWAWKLYKRDRCCELLDPALKPTATEEEVKRCVQIALLCTQANRRLRPDIRNVIVMLLKKSGKLTEPHRPGTSTARHNGKSEDATTSKSTYLAGGRSNSPYTNTTNTTELASADKNSTSSSTPILVPKHKRPPPRPRPRSGDSY